MHYLELKAGDSPVNHPNECEYFQYTEHPEEYFPYVCG